MIVRVLPTVTMVMVMAVPKRRGRVRMAMTVGMFVSLVVVVPAAGGVTPKFPKRCGRDP